MNSSLSLSWQTQTLTFRNTSWARLKRRLEAQYETAICLYHRRGDDWLDEEALSPQMATEPRSEIRLKLFMYWDQVTGNLVVRGVEGRPA